MTIPLRKIALWLGILIVGAYFTCFQGGFHFDDSHSIESNLAIRSFSNLPSLWTDNRTSSFIPENRVYRPLVYTFYTFCWAIGGGKTWPFHFMKMAMHLMVCLGLFMIWSRLWREPGWFPVKNLTVKFPLISREFTITPEWAALFLATLFAIHPAGSECVDYIAATTSLQCAMFYIWAFYSYLLWRDSGKAKFLGMALFVYFLSVASKEEGITLPAMIAVTELFLNKGNVSERISKGFGRVLPFAGLAVALGGWIYYFHPTEGNESRGFATPMQYFITQWRAYLWYMRLWFWPWDLNADNASIEFSKAIDEPLVIQAALGNLLVIGFSWFNRKRFPAMLFGMIWFYVTISPASSIVVLAEAINEHRMYLSYIGFVGGTFTVLLWCGENFFAADTRARRLGAIYALIMVGLVVGTQERNRVWYNDENLWADTVEKNPTSGRALNNLALVYLAKGDYAKASGYLEKCEQYWSTYMYCSLNKGIAYQALGKTDDAEKALQRAYSLNPKSVHVNYHMARFYEDVKKDLPRALAHYKVAIDNTGGRYPSAELRVANIQDNLKQFNEAKNTLRHALTVEPSNEEVLFTLGKVELDSQNYSGAISTYEQLFQVNSNHLQGWYNYGIAQMAAGQLDLALKAFERTVALDPKSEQGWYNLSYVAERLKDGPKALSAGRQLASISQKADYQSRLQDLERKYGQAQASK